MLGEKLHAMILQLEKVDVNSKLTSSVASCKITGLCTKESAYF